MTNKYCNICRKRLPEECEELTCARESCQTTNAARKGLATRINQFKSFWAEHTPTEENYKEYLTLIGKEESYQAYGVNLQARGFSVPSRRTFFQVNFASVHHNWPDEFGRHFSAGADNESRESKRASEQSSELQ
jgi:hypothetical protein